MALHVAHRLTLIAFATVAMRGVLDRAGLEATLNTALLAGAIAFPIGLVLGDLARRLIEDTVRTEVERVLQDVLHLDGVEQQSASAQTA